MPQATLMEPKLWAGVCELFVKAKFFGNVVCWKVKPQSPLEAFKPLRLLTVKLFSFLCFSLLKCEVPVKPVKTNKVIIHTISFWLAKRSGRWNGSQTEKQRRPSPQHPQQPAPSIVFKKTQPSLYFGSSLRPKQKNAVTWWIDWTPSRGSMQKFYGVKRRCRKILLR